MISAKYIRLAQLYDSDITEIRGFFFSTVYVYFNKKKPANVEAILSTFYYFVLHDCISRTKNQNCMIVVYICSYIYCSYD